MAIHVELVSPEQSLFEGEAELVVARTSDGEIGFQSGHVPFVGVLSVGETRLVMSDGSRETIAVNRGFIEFANDHLTLLSDMAELAADVDVAAAREDLAAADASLGSDPHNEAAKLDKLWAEARLRAAEG